MYVLKYMRSILFLNKIPTEASTRLCGVYRSTDKYVHMVEKNKTKKVGKLCHQDIDIARQIRCDTPRDRRPRFPLI